MSEEDRVSEGRASPMVALRSTASLAGDFAAGRSAPSAELERLLDRIARYDGNIRAFAHLAIEEARAAARASDARWARGATLSNIDGMVLGIKDIYETANMPTGQGSPIWCGTHTRRDSAAVQALREAGSIILGKTTTTEFALTEPLHETRNPHDLNRTPGGSSSGSAAAVAAGFVHAALGTQVIGSTIRPASFCGCFAFKPSMGALNRSGSFDHFSHSCMGVLGPDLASLWHVACAISAGVGGDPGYPAFDGAGELAAPQRPRRLAALYPPAWARTASSARTAFGLLLERLKAAGIEIADSRTFQELAAVSADWEDAEERVKKIIDWEMRWPLGAYVADHSSLLSERLRQRFADGRRLSIRDYQEQLVWRAKFREDYSRASLAFDAAITLSAPGAAPQGRHFTGDPGLNVIASVLGVPSISLPLLADEGLPLGLQVIGRNQGDESLFAVSRWLAETVGRTPAS